MAAHALKPENKTVWLRIAQVWTNLAHLADENDKRQSVKVPKIQTKAPL